MARKGDEDSEGVKVFLTKERFVALAKKHEEFKKFAERYKYRAEVETVGIGIRKFSLPALETLQALYKASGSAMGDRWAMGQIAAHVKAIKTHGAAKIEQLRAMETAMIEFFKRDSLRLWVFDKSGKRLQAKFIRNIFYQPRIVTREGGVSPAYIGLSLVWWDRGRESTGRVSWYAGEAIGKTVEECLLEKHLFHETPELIAAYDEEEAKFMEWRKLLGEQFVGAGEFQVTDGDDGRRRDRRSSDAVMAGTRLIVDDPMDEIENYTTTGIFTDYDPKEDSDEELEELLDENGSKREDAALKGVFERMPIDCFVKVFNLSSYNTGWVHVADVKPYVYRPELKDKLILPPEHADLIDILASDSDVLMEDIISGKSGGTAILCQGKAGTGKTLTAEVYSEVVKRPLYRVHSGQLGTDALSVESALKVALENSMRWRAVMLIDEADVFVAARGDDMEKNAVIGVFLRTLEYYSGLLFMTTNRVDDIDEAILSRCIAVIQYDTPDAAVRERLWETLGGVYGLNLIKDKAMARKLAQAFECNGRDIKGLTKLVTKYARKKGRAPTFADFKQLAQFKGLKVSG